MSTTRVVYTGWQLLKGFYILPEKGRPLQKETQVVEEVVLIVTYRRCLCYCMHYYSSVMGGFRWRVNQRVIAASEAEASLDYMWTRVQLDSLQLLQAEWVKQESATSYPPKVLKYIVAIRTEWCKYITRKQLMDTRTERVVKSMELEQWKSWRCGLNRIRGSTCYTISDSGSLIHLVYYRNELMPYNYILTHAQH